LGFPKTEIRVFSSCVTIRRCEELRWYLRSNHIAVEAVSFDCRLHLLLPEKVIGVGKFLKDSVGEKDRGRGSLRVHRSTHYEQKEKRYVPGSRKKIYDLDTMIEIDNQE